MLSLSHFDYHLPKGLIAQYPAKSRDESRLMVIRGKKIEHAIFKNIDDFLQAGDLLVFNDTKVIPARLKGEKIDSGGKIELLLLREIDKNHWQAKAKGSRRLKPGMKIAFEGTELLAEVAGKKEEGEVILKFDSHREVKEDLWQIGKIPLPPYIKREVEESDSQRYQTIFARVEGAIAAPTAGLHFTSELMERLEKKGIDFTLLTLNVGLGTFSPIRDEDLTKHRMEREFFYLPQKTADKINQARRENRRIIAVGTTTVRVLETLADKKGEISSGQGWTGIFIYPGYKFKIVNGMVTNFHLPRTTLFLLVCAFLTREEMFEAYGQAVQEKYRFYSYGDAMLILKN